MSAACKPLAETTLSSKEGPTGCAVMLRVGKDAGKRAKINVYLGENIFSGFGIGPKFNMSLAVWVWYK
jgi:hypothetical protein